MHHAIWPEGLPDQAVHTTSWWRAHWTKLKLQTHYLRHVRSARRVRHALSEEGMPDPHAAERMLQRAGAIAPPGGWARSTTKPESGKHEVPVQVVTHSVI